MRQGKKKLIESIANWVEGNGRDENSWVYEGDTVITAPVSAAFRIWEHYRKTGGLPEPGGWLDQPLDILVMIGVFQTVFETYSYKNQKDADWGKFTETQNELIRQVERSALSV